MTTQPSTAEAVRQSIAEVAKRPLEDVQPEAKLMDDLGIRSFSRVELAVVLEERLGVSLTDAQVMRFSTVADVIAAVGKA